MKLPARSPATKPRSHCEPRFALQMLFSLSCPQRPPKPWGVYMEGDQHSLEHESHRQLELFFRRVDGQALVSALLQIAVDADRFGGHLPVPVHVQYVGGCPCVSILPTVEKSRAPDRF